jgi:hypothetical protein
MILDEEVRDAPRWHDRPEHALYLKASLASHFTAKPLCRKGNHPAPGESVAETRLGTLHQGATARERDAKAGPYGAIIDIVEAGLIGLAKLSCDVQTETRAVLMRREEGLEDAGPLRRRNARPHVHDLDEWRSKFTRLPCLQGDLRDLSRLSPVVKRVLHQNRHRLVQLRGIDDGKQPPIARLGKQLSRLKDMRRSVVFDKLANPLHQLDLLGPGYLPARQG